MKYRFKAKSLTTGNVVKGDLVYATQINFKNHTSKVKPMIVQVCCHGGMTWCQSRTFIDENSLELIMEE